jgi:hypothetical protein
MISFNGKTQSLYAWGREIGIKPSTLRSRFKQKWSVERMLTTPTLNKSEARRAAALKQQTIYTRLLRDKLDD